MLRLITVSAQQLRSGDTNIASIICSLASITLLVERIEIIMEDEKIKDTCSFSHLPDRLGFVRTDSILAGVQKKEEYDPGYATRSLTPVHFAPDFPQLDAVPPLPPAQLPISECS